MIGGLFEPSATSRPAMTAVPLLGQPATDVGQAQAEQPPTFEHPAPAIAYAATAMSGTSAGRPCLMRDKN
ncbi:hypothetical protein EAH80_05640 [Mycobacterium hodleri]|uniref:Uncharacterized protein n=1 Tax=Mycolicibacterium hodleri TaxID=49897 RepID=A0A502EIH6_9MYCO|nr:hypothetical protein EAH80_05640 [Mycolicibacterium hodleri]